jgi:hypothetical protein
MNEEQVKLIKNHLYLVFKHECEGVILNDVKPFPLEELPPAAANYAELPKIKYDHRIHKYPQTQGNMFSGMRHFDDLLNPTVEYMSVSVSC